MKLAVQIMSYSAANIINAAVPFFLLPILTAYFLPQEYGMLSLVSMFQTLLIPLVLMNFHGLIVIEYSNLSSENFSKFISTIIWIPVFGLFLNGTIILIFRNNIAKLFQIPPFWIVASIGFVFFQALPLLIPVLFQAQKSPKKYGVFKISLTATNMVFSLIFVIVFKSGWEGRMWGIFISFVMFNFISIIYLLKEGIVSLQFDLKYFKDALRFGIPLIPHVMSGTILAMSDRVFLVNLLTSKEVGIYSVAYQIACAVMIVMTSINQAWVPHLFEKLNGKPTLKDKRVLIIQAYKIMGLMVVITVCFMVSVPLLFNIFIDKKYHAGKQIAIMVAIGFLFQGFYFMVTNYIFYAKKTHWLSILTLISAIIVSLLNFLLIPIFGIIAPAYSMLLAWLAMFIMSWFLAQHVYPMPWWKLL